MLFQGKIKHYLSDTYIDMNYKKYFILFLATIFILSLFLGFNKLGKHRAIASNDNKVTFLTTTRDALLSRETYIKNENKAYYEVNFIFRYNSEYTKYHMVRLRNLARRGVEVNLLLDYYGSADNNRNKPIIPKALVKHLTDEGVNIKFFNMYKGKGLTSLKKLLYRLHSKIIFFEGLNSTIIGDRNMSGKYFSLDKNIEEGMRSFEGLFEGESISKKVESYLTNIFNSDKVNYMNFNNPEFNVDDKEVLAIKKELDDIELYFKNRNSKRIFKKSSYNYWKSRLKPANNIDFIHDRMGSQVNIGTASYKLLDEIKKAKKSIALYSPYFVLNKENKEALKIALNKGIDIKFYIGTSHIISDEPWINTVMGKDLKIIKDMGIDVYVLDHNKTSKIDHKKVYIIDDKILMGSNNYDNRSQIWDEEIAMVIHDKKRANELRHIFHKTNTNTYSKLTNSKIIELDACTSIFKKIIGRYILRSIL